MEECVQEECLDVINRSNRKISNDKEPICADECISAGCTDRMITNEQKYS